MKSLKLECDKKKLKQAVTNALIPARSIRARVLSHGASTRRATLPIGDPCSE